VRITRSIGVAVVTLIAALAIGLASTISSAVQLLVTTALVMTGTFTPTPSQQYLDMAKDQYVVPALGDNYGPYVPVTTPEEGWPITGLFDYTFGTSVKLGLQDLEAEMANYPNEPLLIFGFSQSSVIWNLEKRKLAQFAEEHPDAPVPDITFVCIGCLNMPNGGVMSMYWGAYIPLINFYFNGPAPTDTPFKTVMITNEYDGFADTPRFPLLPLSTLNGILGMLYAHGSAYEDLSLAPDPTKYLQGTHGDTTYYFFPNPDLPLFGPLRSLGVSEGFIDIFEPFFKVVVDWGYDRSIPPWEPTRAGLIPIINPFTAAADLLKAIDEGIQNAFEFFGTPPPIAIPAPVTTASATSATAPDTAEEVTETPSTPVTETLAAEPEPEAAPEPAAETEEATEAKPAAETDSTEPEATKPEESDTTKSSTRSASTEPADTAVSHPLRPKLRGPVGLFGPRVRDFLHRGHTESSTQARAGEETGGGASSTAVPAASPPSGGADGS
jgi:PE-PPE domain